ncbi:hypothetical protein NVP1210O_09 [Vibrio phage 1.210.O._10N.222.52.C2]|nr:hypothetical protein NVP1210O_09 [Vibrio phage 1.210.O._10N.222.52.C2]
MATQRVVGRQKIYELLDFVGYDYSSVKGRIVSVTVNCDVDDAMTFDIKMLALNTKLESRHVLVDDDN